MTSQMSRLHESGTAAWPDLTLSAWADTRDTFHLWTQVVGKVRLALEPMVNHWWQVPLYVTARGLDHVADARRAARGIEIEFDLVDHVLDLRTTDGRRRSGRVSSRVRSRASTRRRWRRSATWMCR